MAALLVCAARAQAAAPSSPASGPGRSHPAILDKTRFLADMGLGAFAAYHFVYKPWQNGDFTSGTLAVLIPRYAKAGLALAFAYNRFNAAYKIANSSHDPVLHALAAPLNKLSAHFNKESADLKHGHYNSGDMQSMYNETSKFYALTHSSGYNITQIPSRIPGVS